LFLERDILEKDIKIKRLEEQATFIVQELDKFQVCPLRLLSPLHCILWDQTSLQQEKARRETARQQLRQQLSSLATMLHVDLESTQKTYTAELRQLSDDVRAAEQKHNEQKELMRQTMQAETDKLTQLVEGEKQEREAGEEQIISTIEKVFGTYQTGLTALKT
jgi:DNA anti-recombination protein RmuC